MSVIFFDGFDSYPDQNFMAQRGWDRNGIFTEAGRFGDGRSMRFGGGNSQVGRPVPTGTTYSCGFGFKLNQMGGAFANGKHLFGFRDSNNNDIAKLGVWQNGKLAFGRQNWTDQLLCESAISLIIPNIWNYVEVEYTEDATAGSVKVYLNGALICQANGVNTGNQTITQFKWFGEDLDADKWLDDLYITDTAVRLGECRIAQLLPSSDTAQKQFTPSTGTDNFACVDEATPNSDSDYVSSSTVGAYDLYNLTNLPYTPATVHGVTAIMTARKDDAELRQIRSKVKSGATTADGATLTLTTAYSIQTQLLTQDPDASAAWTPTSVNALQAGFELV